MTEQTALQSALDTLREFPAAADEAAYADNLIASSGRDQSIRDLLIFNFRAFLGQIAETAAFGRDPTELQLLEYMAAGTEQAAEIFRCARDHQLLERQSFIEAFMAAVEFAYPDPALPPEDAAVELAAALDRAVAAARRLIAAGSKPGRKEDIGLNSFIRNLIDLLGAGHRVELVHTALKMAVELGRARLDKLPIDSREALSARLDEYERLDPEAIGKRVSRILKASKCQEAGADAIRANRRN